jgi:hypothetical protein
MATGNNNERIREAAERSTPPLPPEVRKRALWAVMAALRGRGRGPRLVVALVALLVLGAAAYALVCWLRPGR